MALKVLDIYAPNKIHYQSLSGQVFLTSANRLRDPFYAVDLQTLYYSPRS